MPPDLILTATWEGMPTEFIARDLPAGVFWCGFQDTFPGAECFGRLSAAEQRDNIRGHEAWTDALLCRAMVAPRLTLEGVRRLGDARDELAVAYLWGIGYQAPSSHTRERLVPPRRTPADPERPWLWLEDYDALQTVPSPNNKLAINAMARVARIAPSRIWADWSITEFVWTWHVALRDDLKKRGARSSTAFPESDIVARVGRERSNGQR